jgi:DNA-binding protein WhiA
LRLDEHAVVAGTRADANRLANADEANVRRTVQAARRQLQAIEQLDVETLPRKLREVATLRVKHPALSLAELAAKCRPPITKAAAHHRMAALQRLAGD